MFLLLASVHIDIVLSYGIWKHPRPLEIEAKEMRIGRGLLSPLRPPISDHRLAAQPSVKWEVIGWVRVAHPIMRVSLRHLRQGIQNYIRLSSHTLPTADWTCGRSGGCFRLLAQVAERV